MDTNCPMGPYLVTRDEVQNPYNLLAYTLQNNRVRDRAHTGSLLLGFERTIAYYSSFATLYPGDVIHLGTIGVDGLPYTVDFSHSEGSDTVGAEIEKIGRLIVPLRYEKRVWDSEQTLPDVPPEPPVVRNLYAIDRE